MSITSFTAVSSEGGSTALVTTGLSGEHELTLYRAHAGTPVKYPTYIPSLRAVTSNVATLTVGPNKFSVGDIIKVENVNSAVFNGIFQITGVTSTTITYMVTSPNVTSGAAGTGAVVKKLIPEIISLKSTMTDTFAYPDRTAAFGTELTYVAVATAGASTFSARARVTLPYPTDVSVCYPCLVSDPISLVQQAATLQIYRPFSTAARQSVNNIIGQKYPIVLSGYRQAPTGTIALITHTLAQADTMRAILDTGRTVIFRVPPEARSEAPAAALAIGGVSEEPVIFTDIERPERKWTLEFTEIAMPTAQELGYGLDNTWSEVGACYNWDTIPVGTTWNDLVYDPSLADC
jgi:hypothetical protein